MKFTVNEKIKITRWRLGLRQDQFYNGICDQQTGSAIESDSWSGLPATLEIVINKVLKKYPCEPKNIKIQEFIKILRCRMEIDLDKASEILNKSRAWIIGVEKGIYYPNLTFKVFYKIYAKNSS